MILETKFDLKQLVKINEINKNGRIVAIYISETGNQFSVRYFIEGVAHTNYFYEEELSTELEEKVLGFTKQTV